MINPYPFWRESGLIILLDRKTIYGANTGVGESPGKKRPLKIQGGQGRKKQSDALLDVKFLRGSYGLTAVDPRLHAARQAVDVLEALALQKTCRNIPTVSDAAGNDDFLVCGDLRCIFEKRRQRQMCCLPDMAG